jgi:hypothetical protein
VAWSTEARELVGAEMSDVTCSRGKAKKALLPHVPLQNYQTRGGIRMEKEAFA